MVTDRTYFEDANRWLKIFFYKDSGTIIQLQDDCNYRVPEILENKKLIKKIFGKGSNKNLFAYEAIYNNKLSDLIFKILQRLANENSIQLDKTKEIPMALNKFFKAGLRVNLFLSHVTNLLSSRQLHQLYELDAIIRQSPNFSVIIFSEVDLTNEKYYMLLNRCSSIFKNVIKYPFYSREDSLNFIRITSIEWNLDLSLQTIDEIIIQCGGYFWLISQTLRYLRNYPDASLEEAFDDDLMLSKLNAIWSKFTPVEQVLIKRTAYQGLIEKDLNTHEFKYLSYIGAIIGKEGNYQLGLPLLKKLFAMQEGKVEITCNDGQIFRNGKNISKNFSRGELALLNLLILNGGQIIERESIAQKIWADRWREKYSDWAIDRLIFRLRKRLEGENIDSRKLQTVKSVGIIWNEHD